MRKPLAIAAAALVAVTSFASSGAYARDRGAVAAGVIGGLAVGAIAGAAIANSNRTYVYDEYPVYTPRVRVHRHYYEPSYSYDYYSGYGGYSGYGYSSGYYDGYRDAGWDW
jgi:hypothetical protein